MQPIITSHRAEIADLCRRYSVRRLEVFGSAVRADFDAARSDVDLLVEFGQDAPRTLAHYFEFKEALEGLLERPVDLVEASAVKNPYLLASIERSKELLFAA